MTESGASPTAAPLGATAARAMGWTAMARAGTVVIQFVTGAVLPALLLRSELGLVVMARSVTELILYFQELGTGAAVIQRRELNERLLGSLFWLNVGVGVLAATALVLGAPLIAAGYWAPDLASLLVALAPIMVLSTISTVHGALLRRHLAMGRLAAAELIAVAASGAAAIAAAAAGLGAWCLVVQTLVGMGLLSSLTMLLSGWRPRTWIDGASVRSVALYSGGLAANNGLTYAARWADKILIGRFLGQAAVGSYGFIQHLVFLPVRAIMGVVGNVAFPVLSRVPDDDERFRSIYVRLLGVLAAIAFPCCFGLALVGREVVSWLYAEHAQAAMVPAILLPAALLQVVVSPAGFIYTARGRTDLMLTMTAVSTAVLLAAFAIGLQGGITGVAWAHSIAFAVTSLPVLAVPYRLIGLRFAPVVRELARPLACSVLMAAAVRATEAGLPEHWHPGAGLAVAVAVGVATYAAASWLVNRERVTEVLALGRRGFADAPPAGG